MTRSNIRFPPLPPCWSRRAAFSSGIGVKVSHDRCKRRSPAAPPGRGLVFRARRRGDRVGRLARPRHGRGHVRLRYRPLPPRHPPDRRGGAGQGRRRPRRSRRRGIRHAHRWLGPVDRRWRLAGGGRRPCRPALSRSRPRRRGHLRPPDRQGGGRFYPPWPPPPFPPTIYMGEAACARLLHDPAGTLAALQRRTTPYPAALAGALRERFEWEAEFALANARKSLGVYLLNEKGAVAAAGGFARAPSSFAVRVAAVFA